MGGRLVRQRLTPAIDLSVVRGVGTPRAVVPGSVGSYPPVIAGAKLREGYNHDLAKRGRALPGVALSSMRFHPTGRGEDDEDGKRVLYDGNRIPHRIDRRLSGLAGPDYDAPISMGCPCEPDSQLWEIPDYIFREIFPDTTSMAPGGATLGRRTLRVGGAGDAVGSDGGSCGG